MTASAKTHNTDLHHPAREELQLTQVLFALSDPGRLDIVRQVAAGPLEMAQCRLQDPAMPKSTKSHMMKVLRESGLVRNDPMGRGRCLTLRRADLEARFPGLLEAVLGAAPEADAGTTPDQGAEVEAERGPDQEPEAAGGAA